MQKFYVRLTAIENITFPAIIFQNGFLLYGLIDPSYFFQVCGITNRTYTYHHLYKSSRIFAANLRSKLKVQTGDVICIMKHNSPEFVVALLGILDAGGEVTTVNPIYTSCEY